VIDQKTIFYRDGDYIYNSFDGKKSYRIVAELETGFLVVYHAYFETAVGAEIKFINNATVGKKQVTKL
jgi:hypothetical protein